MYDNIDKQKRLNGKTKLVSSYLKNYLFSLHYWLDPVDRIRIQKPIFTEPDPVSDLIADPVDPVRRSPEPTIPNIC